MSFHRYSLEKGTKKYNCPSCRENKRFRRYIDTNTGDHIADEVGLCDRENSCGYHFTPKQYFNDNPNNLERPQVWLRPEPIQTINRPIDYLPIELLEKSVLNNEKCSLFPFFKTLFGYDVAKQLCDRYFIGTNKDGHTVFWQVDFKAEIRQAKIMEYDSSTGRRNKEFGALYAGKKILGNNDANLQQCFFGEVYLALNENKEKIVAIVESEKTAAIASIYYPKYLWIATGGKYGCKWTEKTVCKVLEGCKVILYPDLGAYDNWNEKGKLLANVAGCKVVVSDLLEINANDEERKAGLDIADFLLRVKDSTGLALTDYHYPAIWDLKKY